MTRDYNFMKYHAGPEEAKSDWCDHSQKRTA